jgi:signal transduction histidine kinase
VIDGLNQMSDQHIGVLGRRLYPGTLGQGLVPTFQALGDRPAGAPTVVISLDEALVRQEKADSTLFPELVKLALYRIAEEALANAVQHAGASQVTLRLDPLRPGWLSLWVLDDGQGFDLDSVRGGLGIATMQDYARAMGGECVIQSAPGRGTEITAALPLSAEKGAH